MPLLDTDLMKEAALRSWRQLPWLGPLFVGSAWLNFAICRVMGLDPALPMSAQGSLAVSTLCCILALQFVFGSVEMVIGLGLLRMLSRHEKVTLRAIAVFTYTRFLASLRGFFPVLWRLLAYSVVFMLLTGLIYMTGGGDLVDRVGKMNEAAASPLASAILGFVLFIVLLPVTFATFDCVYDDLSFHDAYALAKARVAPRRLAIAANLLLIGLPAILLILPGREIAVLLLQQTLSSLLFIPPVMLFYLYQERFEAESALAPPLSESGLLPVDGIEP